MGSSFEKALNLFSESEKELILENLNNWRASGQRFMKIGNNIYNENNFQNSLEYKKVLSIFLKKSDYLPRFLRVCNSMSFNGRKVDERCRPNVVGRVILKKKYRKILTEIYRLNKTQIEEFLYLVFINDKTYMSKYSNVFLSKGVTWVTWNENDPNGDPFHFVEEVENNEGVICLLLCHNLGLNHMQQGLIHTSITYDISSNLDLKIPVVTDAVNHAYFRPSPSKSCHGLTMNYYEAESQKSGLGEFHITPRPEAIHGDMTINQPDRIFIEDLH